ncbi:hypothetical protein OUZ56_003046 [Daphnia magna]|uniref:Uncharacterized protein n=1 Tax=Daphnia magna TaxID=35525 RepID=A0ABR0A7K2_9CRUS|nr:hypothetical protein OUZ56_003046 [Daphnia magna]
MSKRTNPRLPSCPRDPSRRLHPLRELSSVPDHLTEEADSRGESVETARGLDSDPETEIDLRAATSPVVPAVGQQFVVPSRHIEQPQRQAMEGVRKFISSLIFRKSSEEVAHQLMERFEEYSTHNRWGDIGKNNNFEKYFHDAARSWFKCARLPNEWMVNLKRPEDMRLQRLFRGRRQATIREIQETFKQVSATGRKKNEGVKVPYLPRGRKLIFCLINLRGSQKISTVGSPVLKKGDLSRVKRDIGYLFAEMSHPLLGQSCDRGEEIIGRSPLQERYADMQSGRGVIRATV